MNRDQEIMTEEEKMPKSKSYRLAFFDLVADIPKPKDQEYIIRYFGLGESGPKIAKSKNITPSAVYMQIRKILTRSRIPPYVLRRVGNGWLKTRGETGTE